MAKRLLASISLTARFWKVKKINQYQIKSLLQNKKRLEYLTYYSFHSTADCSARRCQVQDWVTDARWSILNPMPLYESCMRFVVETVKKVFWACSCLVQEGVTSRSEIGRPTVAQNSDNWACACSTHHRRVTFSIILIGENLLIKSYHSFADVWTRPPNDQ